MLFNASSRLGLQVFEERRAVQLQMKDQAAVAEAHVLTIKQLQVHLNHVHSLAYSLLF
jgi:hypothetical protein